MAARHGHEEPRPAVGPVEGARSRMSLRTLSVVTTVLFGLLVTALVVGLLLGSRLVWRSAVLAEAGVGAVVATVELTHALREYNRLQTLSAATDEPELAAAASLSEVELRLLLAAMHARAKDADEQALLHDLTGDVDALVAGWTAVNASDDRLLAERVRATRPFMESAVARTTDLRNREVAALREARADASRAIGFEVGVSVAVTIVLVFGLGLVALGMRRVVLDPIFALHNALRRFQEGDHDAKTGDGALLELHELGAAFNEMTRAIVRQRREQLTFLAAVAHDLRSPLAVLKMGLQLVAQNGEALTAEGLGRFERQVDRLSRMVGDLLDTAKIEAGELDLQPRPFDLRGAVTAMVELYAPSSADHEVEVTLPDEPVVARVDALRIEQVVSNLLSNAIKYSPEGGTIIVALGLADREAVLTVSDEGIGMVEDDLAGLFQPFKRGARTAGVFPGVGLGLSIVRRIVRAHGGRIEVESRLGAGTTFRVFLPLAEGPVPGTR
jgi:two-component system, OmpR family, sensor histidine kinase MtrB